jgi:hypothetical protein
LAPVPEVAALAELNELILAGVARDLHRRIDGRSFTVADALTREGELMWRFPAEAFPCWEESTDRSPRSRRS